MRNEKCREIAQKKRWVNVAVKLERQKNKNSMGKFLSFKVEFSWFS